MLKSINLQAINNLAENQNWQRFFFSEHHKFAKNYILRKLENFKRKLENSQFYRNNQYIFAFTYDCMLKKSEN